MNTVPSSQMPEIDVIIPVHNGERTIAQTLRSVARQTYPNVHTTLVFNGCTDRSAEIARAALPSARSIHMDRADAYEARRAGAEATESPLVLFLDADDTLHPSALMNARSKMETTGSDIVQLRIVQQIHLGPLRLRFRFPCRFDPTKALEGAICDPGAFNPGIPAKLFRRTALLPFPDTGYTGFWGEDRLFSLHVYSRHPKVAYAPEAIYLYRFGGQSRMTGDDTRELEMREIHRLKRMFLSEHGMESRLPDVDRELESLLAWRRAAIKPSFKSTLKTILSKISQS